MCLAVALCSHSLSHTSTNKYICIGIEANENVPFSLCFILGKDKMGLGPRNYE